MTEQEILDKMGQISRSLMSLANSANSNPKLLDAILESDSILLEAMQRKGMK